MAESGFIACEHVFSFKCSGEVANLLHAAERYGVLMEEAGARIETVCRQCNDFSCVSSLKKDDETGTPHRNRQREPGKAGIRAIA